MLKSQPPTPSKQKRVISGKFIRKKKKNTLPSFLVKKLCHTLMRKRNQGLALTKQIA
jgi:hypothetical protein